MTNVNLTKAESEALGAIGTSFPGIFTSSPYSLVHAVGAGTLKYYTHNRGGIDAAAIKRKHVENIANNPQEEFFGIISVSKLGGGKFVVNDGHHRLEAFDLGLSKGTIHKSSRVLLQVVDAASQIQAYTTINAQNGHGVTQQVKNIDLIYGWHLFGIAGAAASVKGASADALLKLCISRATHLSQIVEAYRQGLDLRKMKFGGVLFLRHAIKSQANVPHGAGGVAGKRLTRVQINEIAEAVAHFYEVRDLSIGSKRKGQVDDGTKNAFAKSAFFGLFLFEYLRSNRTWARWDAKRLSRQIIKSATELAEHGRILTSGRDYEIEGKVVDIRNVMHKHMRRP